MHAKELSSLASWAAFNSRNMIYGVQPQLIFATNKYWTNAKCRHQRWMMVLKMFELDLEEPLDDHDPLPAMEIVIEEIFLTEMLSRVWSAILVAHDRYHKTDELAGVAHSVHISHIEAKNRCMRLLLREELQDHPIVVRCNQMRKKIERWTDMLLGEVPDLDAASTFAFEAKRVEDFVRERLDSSEDSRKTRELFYSMALAKDLQRATSGCSANPEINRKVAAGVLACFPANRFDSAGLPKSVQALWIENVSEDTQMLINGLYDMDSHSILGADQAV